MIPIDIFWIHDDDNSFTELNILFIFVSDPSVTLIKTKI